MTAASDLAGMRFGRLLAIARVGRTKRGQAIWSFRCDCGELTSAVAANVLRGNTTSCGCAHREQLAQRQTRHGHARGPTYRSWQGMKDRCNNPANAKFKDYGARGVKVHGPWKDSFETFLQDMGRRPQGTTLDRRDNDGDYVPGNCRWATPKQQAGNRRPRKR